MQVLITNTVVLNGGDAAILTAIVRELRKVLGDETTIAAADTQSDLARLHYPENTFITPLYVHAFPPKREGRFQRLRGAARFARWYLNAPRLYAAATALGRGHTAAARGLVTRAEWQTLQYYAESDLIISTGGTYLVENYWLGPRIFDFRIALLLGKPLVLYTQSMGPFRSDRVRRALRRIFEQAFLILLRDEVSLENLLDICDAADVRVYVAPDAAFGLADPVVLRNAAAAEVPTEEMRAAISVREWPFFETMSPPEGMDRYIDAVARLAEHLAAEHGASITFVSTCQGVPGYTYDDSEVAERVRARISDEFKGRVSVDRDFHRPDDLLERLQGFDVVVATRMHMAILSLAAGVPVLPIAYEFKTRALFERLGLAEFVSDIESITGDELCNRADRWLIQLRKNRAELFRKVEEERRRAADVAELLLAVLPASASEDDVNDQNADHGPRAKPNANRSPRAK